MGALANKRVLLGVSAGIAAYKSAELVRLLRREQAQVRVVMTPAATAFITPLTLQALSGHPVRSALLDPAQEAAMDHIELARWAQVILVAPATADLLARLAHGLADDLLSTVCLASEAPLLLAPAMNRQMWLAAATVHNRRVLERRGAVLIGPDSGEQACGEQGPGRMSEPQQILEQLAAHLSPPALAGLSVMVTAGPTHEPMDPVRFLGNRSSGKMGYAIARAAREAGASVTLVSGPVALEAPAGVERVCVSTAEQMRREVLARINGCAIFIAAAAVADYRPARVQEHKIKKSQASLELHLERTADILGEVATLPAAPFTVGFAAETEDLEGNARAKLRDKGLDMVAANRVDLPGLGLEADDNALSVLWDGGAEEFHARPKPALARALISLIAERYGAQGTAQSR